MTMIIGAGDFTTLGYIRKTFDVDCQKKKSKEQ
jgi:hypothetical protein